MALLEKIGMPLPDRREASPDTSRHLFNYRRMWKLAVFLTGGVTLLPLISITLVDYRVTQHAIESEFLSRATRIVSNTRRTISFFLTERKAALEFIVHDNSLEALSEPSRLSAILENLQKSFGGGFVDLGVIDSAGRQRNYVGPYNLGGRNYRDQDWYRQVLDHGSHISDVFLGYRQVPHMVIAVKGLQADGTSFVLRAAIGINPFQDLLSNMEIGGMGDAFLVNQEGTLQTPSRYYGKVLDRVPLQVPAYSPKTEVFEEKALDGKNLVFGYRFIDQTPFVLMVIKDKRQLMKPWFRTRLKLIVFLVVSIALIVSVILAMATYMVRRIRIADEKRVMTLHQVEYANKMASIGRMAANVAHEINNPLAIINEKAGLIKDLFSMMKEYAPDPKLRGLVDAILVSVKRAGTITKRLLAFARNFEAAVEPVNLREVIEEVLGFLEKEAEHRGIVITLNAPDDLASFESDRGKLQQIFLNIINNAFAAVENEGRLDIEVKQRGKDSIEIEFSDNGCGIAPGDLERIFEPFFSTKANRGGTGLGLSITYNLVRGIGGRISVHSDLGKGTRFTIALPLHPERKEKEA